MRTAKKHKVRVTPALTEGYYYVHIDGEAKAIIRYPLDNIYLRDISLMQVAMLEASRIINAKIS